MCWYCGGAMDASRVPGFSELCLQCGRELHACRNCLHFLSGSRADCAESQAEAVADKEKRNHCEWFRLSSRVASGSAASPECDKASNAKADFDKLFGA